MTQQDDAGAVPWPLSDAGQAAAGPAPAGQAAAPRLAEQVAERLERLALRLRTHGDLRLAVAMEAGDELETIIARVVGDHLREHGA